MAKTSAGLIMYRYRNGELQVLLIHPGGPFWRGRDEGAWSIPKGEIADGETPLDAARREFQEETGFGSQGPYQELKPIRQRSGKIVHAWAFQGDCDPAQCRSNTFKIKTRSGRYITVPEADKAEFFTVADAEWRVNPAQMDLIRELVEMLKREKNGQ